MRMKEILAYTAGIVDGEGCIAIAKRSDTIKTFRLDVSVTNTNEWICHWLKMQFGGKIQSWKAVKPHWKRNYRWKIESKAALHFLEQILPYLNLKRPQAELGIGFQKRKVNYRRYTPPEHTIQEQVDKIAMHHLNKRGVEI